MTGIKVVVDHLDGEQIAADEWSPDVARAKVYVNGLLAGKARANRDHHPDNHDQVATELAWLLAAGRIERWRRAVETWDASAGDDGIVTWREAVQ